jgi:hypothetical protein
VERELPAAATGDAAVIIGDWSVRELGERLSPRWRDLARRAGSPGALDEVFAAWGVAR